MVSIHLFVLSCYRVVLIFEVCFNFKETTGNVVSVGWLSTELDGEYPFICFVLLSGGTNILSLLHFKETTGNVVSVGWLSTELRGEHSYFLIEIRAFIHPNLHFAILLGLTLQGATRSLQRFRIPSSISLV